MSLTYPWQGGRGEAEKCLHRRSHDPSRSFTTSLVDAGGTGRWDAIVSAP